MQKIPKPGHWQTIRDRAFLMRARWDAATGGIERAASALATQIDWSAWQPDRLTVLCLNRAAFSKDVEEMRLRTDLNLVTLSAAKLKAPQSAWIPPEWQLQTYFTGLVRNQLRMYRPFLQQFGKCFLQAVQRTHAIDAILAGNSDYWQDEALRLACNEVGIPFLVLCRENYSIASDQEYIRKHYRDAAFKFSGTAMAVYSDKCKQLVDESGAFPSGAVWSTGAPRFDRWRDVPTRIPEQRDAITLISYAWPFYFAAKNFSEVGEMFAKLAESAGDGIKFVVKVKKENEVQDAIEASPSLKSPAIHFSSDWPLFDLLPRSRAIIGCNSMAVAEGLMTEIPVIVPAWNDALSDPALCIYHYSIPLHSKCIYFPRSAEEFLALVERALRNELPTKASLADRRACFSDHIRVPNETTSSASVAEFIRRYVSASAQSCVGMS